jgi:hypothetical protein
MRCLCDVEKKLHEVLMVVTLVARIANYAMVGWESGVQSQVVGLCWCVWQESRFSRHEDVFTFTLLYEEILQILYFQCDFQR